MIRLFLKKLNLLAISITLIYHWGLIIFFGKNKVRVLTSAGITTKVFIDASQKSIRVYADCTDRNTNPTITEYEKFNISPTISIGIDYKINSRMNLIIFNHGIDLQK